MANKKDTRLPEEKSITCPYFISKRYLYGHFGGYKSESRLEPECVVDDISNCEGNMECPFANV